LRADNRITHQELCFGCGQANLFGLQLELEPSGDDGARGRFFVKQDHQGPVGYAHGGIMATALDEAMSLLAHHVGDYPLTARLEIDLRAPAPVGSFVEVEAEVESNDGRRLRLRATASASDTGELLATAAGTFVETSPPPT
jgi:acyl-coenzyme A thioesterase PaaI-like protein